jgi:hypothetical protein
MTTPLFDKPPAFSFFGVDYAEGEDKPAYFTWDGQSPLALHVKWITYDEFVQMCGVPQEVGHLDSIRFVESPLVPQPEQPMNAQRHIDSKSKLGRRLNSKKVRRSGNSFRNQLPGPKELERGARSYMIASQTNGYPIVQTMSKKQFDKHVEYVLE